MKSEMSSWLLVLLAGVIEVGFTTCMRFISGWRDVGWMITLLVCLLSSIALIQIAGKHIPLGTAYAAWTAIGAAGTVLVGVLWFHEPASLTRLLLIGGVIACVVALKLSE